ncbi:GAF domain-containing protein [Paenibacillus sp. An7]|uniref:GAF domain-containing protein n=1 Tax=Paenibacillus sp. An7 TaxID=2689577 RepID=UPI0013575BC5|nr:GAF domain-containing protein [Paenibacillus sp. An7]
MSFQTTAYEGTREEQYHTVLSQLKGLIYDEPNAIANMANASALLNVFLTDINWVGFYIYDGKELVLGPFQGLPACIRIGIGRGVCGTSAEQRRTIRVENVNEFPGHIACDEATKSEIVVPILKNGELFGVLDIDSPHLSRFDQADQEFLEQFVEILSAQL